MIAACLHIADDDLELEIRVVLIQTRFEVRRR
jgi:hypothetical protein